jgi:putative transposase
MDSCIKAIGSARAKARLDEVQRSLSKKKDGSSRQRRQGEVLARQHRKVANQRKNAAHQLSRRLVNEYDLIALEKLAIQRMASAPKPRHDPLHAGKYLPNGAARKAGLNRSIHDAGWGQAESLGERNILWAGRAQRASARAGTNRPTA